MGMIPYTLTRSKRKSIVICVRDGEVFVAAPLRTDAKTIDSFVESKQGWIEKKLRLGEARAQNVADVSAGERFLFLGERLVPQPMQKKSFAVRDGCLCIPQTYYVNGVLAMSAPFRTAVKNFYKKTAKNILGTRLRDIAEILHLSYGKFALTGAKTKWGSCDAQGNIRLNWHLLLLRKDVVDYVIVHELMHTVEHNHSRRFWNLVAQAYPAYKEAKACLKDAGVLINLYA